MCDRDTPPEEKEPAAASEMSKMLARAQVEAEWAARRARRRVSKGSCLLFTLAALAAGLGGIFYWGWTDKPEMRFYAASPLHNAGRRVNLGKGWSMVLPESWREEGFLTYAADRGLEMAVAHGTVKLLHMTPKAWRNEETGALYTSVAYANGLRKRYPELGETLRSRYVKLGTQEGVEAWLAMSGGRILRAFALVLDAQRVLEIRFHLPGDEKAPEWQEAERIFCSLRYSPSENREAKSPAAQQEKPAK